MPQNETHICGIDPGLEITGYAVLAWSARGPRIADAGVFRTATRAPLADRLLQLATDFTEVLDQWKPTAVGVEQLYAHYKHPRTAIQMAHARGVLLCVAARARAPVHGFNATQIKKLLTGNGRASKVQVQQAVQSIFGLIEPPEPPDVADAVATAYCCGHDLSFRGSENAPAAP